MLKFTEVQNILDVLMKYEILEFFSLVLIGENFCELKLWISWQKTKYH